MALSMAHSVAQHASKAHDAAQHTARSTPGCEFDVSGRIRQPRGTPCKLCGSIMRQSLGQMHNIIIDTFLAQCLQRCKGPG